MSDVTAALSGLDAARRAGWAKFYAATAEKRELQAFAEAMVRCIVADLADVPLNEWGRRVRPLVGPAASAPRIQALILEQLDVLTPASRFYGAGMFVRTIIEEQIRHA